MNKNNTAKLVAVSAIFAAALAIGTFGIIATTTPSAYAQDLEPLKEKHINICSGFDPVCTNDSPPPT
jgi:hypothetical protein